MPLRDFAFSGSKKLKNLLASQGRRLKAGVAKDLGGLYPEVHDVAVTTPQCGGTHSRGTPQRLVARDSTLSPKRNAAAVPSRATLAN